ncbi:hypothetical protein ACFV7Q_37540 [Streptomyces sp. NPDC059851]|uniref:hypothetical protein n=1 Tax=Streptomyces sp. NPDC059851 TaxID=3346971 RepID=UPI0036684498
MEIELTDYMDELVELVELQEANDAAHAVVKHLQEELGKVQKWTDEQHVAWRDAWEDWREVWEPLEDALTHFAEELGLDRGELEAAVQEAAGHVPLAVDG